MTHDHALAGELVRYLQQYEFASVAAFARSVGADRSTVYRMFDGYAGTKPALLRRMERALGLPDYAIDMVKDHDLDGLTQSGAAAPVLSWVDARLNPETGHQASSSRDALGG